MFSAWTGLPSRRFSPLLQRCSLARSLAWPSLQLLMVSPRMAAVLAVALLLLCSGVRSEDMQATITQVKVSDTPSPTNNTAPVITNTTEGSSDTHSAVLANAALGEQDSALVLVDLARDDNQQMSNMTTAAPPSVPEGFDMSESDEADPVFAASTAAPPAESVVPEGFDMSEFGDESPSLAATQDEGHLVPGFPVIGSSQDNSQGQGYGVQTFDASGAGGESLAAYQEDGPSFADTTPGGGTMVPGFPAIGSSPDNSQGQGYGVQAYDAGSSSGAGGDSLAAYQEDGPSFADTTTTQDEGTLVPGFPVIGSSQDYSQGQGYGVQTYDAGSSSGAGGDSLAAYQGDGPSFADTTTQDEGTLVPGFPVIGSSQDYSQGQGYGVQTYDAGSASGGDADSLAAYQEDQSFAVTQDEGTLVPGFPAIGSSQDNSQGQGYGVQTYGAPAPASGGDVLAVYGLDDADSTENVTLTSTPTYRPMPPKPAPAEAWRKGRCTFYGGMDAAGTMSGACGYGNLYASGYGVYTAALSAKLFNNGMACGACYEVACTGKGKPCKAGSIVVTATNFCPPNPGQSASSGGWCNPPNEHFDLSYPAFNRIADPKAGVVPLSFRRVPCKKLGGIRFTLNGNCNFNLVTITNVGGSGVVIEAYMKGDGMNWAPMSRNWGANWQCSRNYCRKGISIKIVTSDKKVSVSKLAGPDWAFGKTYIGQQVK